MKRKDFIKTAGLLAAGAAFSPLTALGKDKNRLVVLHTNDWHSHIEPFAADHKRYPGLGGAAKRASLIKDIRAQYKHVLLLDSGDIFQGTPYYNYYGGELEFKLMSEMGYDYATLGNHDFDGGLDGLVKQMPQASFQFLCANYDFNTTPLDGMVKPYAIKKMGPYKIGLFGIGIELAGLVPDKLYGGIKYEDPIANANKIAQLLKDEGCNIIICLSHLGFEYKGNKVSDKVLAKSSSNIDLILGGHTHTFMSSPHRILNQNGKEIFINQTGWGGINLGRVDYETTSPQAACILGYSYSKIS
ncbi:MAG: 5'-nucleotidase [Bacteroidia bacterium]|jgi:5'-nucleotidase|tara:strand:+ start:820 stop:1722 length:903 start_codon:yes stop_codon:yes gene_type:complete